MNKGLIAALGMGIAALTPWVARAQDRPVFNPTRAVAVTYRMLGGQQEHQVRMYFSPSLHMMRIDGFGHGYMIIDHSKKEAMMVMPPQHMVMEMHGFDPWSHGWQSRADLSFTRAGTDTVAGVPCTVWHVTRQGHQGVACVTADGLPLRMRGQDGHGMEAVSVTYGPQAPSLFVVPKDYRVMVAPAMPQHPGAGMPGGGMGAP